MKTNRDLQITSSPACHPQYTIDVPAGADVIQVAGQGGGYALKNPALYGVNAHDAAHYYSWVPADSVESDPKPRFYHHGFYTGSGFVHFVMDREHGQPFAYRRTRQAAENYASALNCETAAAQQLYNRKQQA